MRLNLLYLYFLKEGKVAGSLTQMGKRRRVGKNCISSECTLNLYASLFAVFVFASSLAGLLYFFAKKRHWWKFERNEGRQAEREKLAS